MTKTSLLPTLVLALLLFLPTGCGKQPSSALQTTPAPTESETVTVAGAAGTLRVQVPAGWKYAIFPEGTQTDSGNDFGIEIWPGSDTDSEITLYRTDSFGVCGTGLKEETMTLAGDTASAGYYDGSKNWTFVCFRGKNSGIIASTSPDAAWFADKGALVLTMLDSVTWEPAA